MTPRYRNNKRRTLYCTIGGLSRTKRDQIHSHYKPREDESLKNIEDMRLRHATDSAQRVSCNEVLSRIATGTTPLTECSIFHFVTGW